MNNNILKKTVIWPKISIITISLNSEATIERTIKSVIETSYPRLEYIIIDGLSTDKTYEIIEKYNDHISFHCSEKDENIPDGFNKGIKKASGELIGIVSSDDYLPPDTLYHVAKVYLKDKKIDVIHGNVICYSKKDSNSWISIPNKKIDNIVSGWGQTYKHAGVYVAKKTYEKYGYFDTSRLYNNDFELMLRFYKKGAKIKYENKILGAFQTGGDNEIHYLKNISLLRDITIEYGYNSFSAFFIYFIKYFLFFLKISLFKDQNKRLVNFYRNISNRFRIDT